MPQSTLSFTMIVGIVADTHGYLDQRLLVALQGVDAIVHAGDVGSDAVLEGLRSIAFVSAVQGNNDVPLGGLGLPEHLDLDLEGVKLHVVHELPKARPVEGTNVVVFGHSHRQVNEWRDGVLYLNPGAAGRRGFHAIQTAALLNTHEGRLTVEPLILGARLQRPKASVRGQSRPS